jgi:hypothetical protein
MQSLSASELLSIGGGSCWDDWSRCTPGVTQVGTGILWLNCQDYCDCKGYETGVCNEVDNTCWMMPEEKKIMQCQCQNKIKEGKGWQCGL